MDVPRAFSRFVTTGEAARRLNVKPDTVLKWIKKGRIPAWKTAGGHHRIEESVVERLLPSPRGGRLPVVQPDRCKVAGCWDYFSQNGQIREACKSCVVYRVRAARCYEMITLGSELGHVRQFCPMTCQDCPYYRRVHEMPLAALVVTSDARLREMLRAEPAPNVTLEFAENAYRASAMVAASPPALVVVDSDLPASEWMGLIRSLALDERIPWVRVFVTGTRFIETKTARELEGVAGFLPKPFRLECVLAALDEVSGAAAE
jgi:excisionase family DNA binding protein